MYAIYFSFYPLKLFTIIKLYLSVKNPLHFQFQYPVSSIPTFVQFILIKMFSSRYTYPEHRWPPINLSPLSSFSRLNFLYTSQTLSVPFRVVFLAFQSIVIHARVFPRESFTTHLLLLLPSFPLHRG